MAVVQTPVSDADTTDSPATIGTHAETNEEASRTAAAASQPNNGADTETAATEGAPRPAHSELQEPLRRTSSKIANLRAAFEKRQDANGASTSLDIPKRRFDRSSSGSQNSEAEMTRLKEQVDAVTRLAEQQEVEAKRLKEELEKEVSSRQAVEEQVKGLKAALADKDHHWQSLLDEQKSISSKESNRLQEDAGRTQQQLLELKRTIATSTRIEHQVSDASIAEQMQYLYHETQNWVVAQFRKTEATSEEMGKKLQTIAEPKLIALKDVFDMATPATRLAALQTVTICYLMEVFQDPLFFGLPNQQRHVKKAAEALPSVLSFEAFNRWRSMTADVLRQSEKIPESVESASKSMSDIICITLNTLTDSAESQSRVAALNSIVKKTISIAHLCKMQRAQYEFELPSPGSAFVSASMENTTGEAEGPSAESRLVHCAQFPSVKKLGDENGENMSKSNIIAKAKVICKE